MHSATKESMKFSSGFGECNTVCNLREAISNADTALELDPPTNSLVILHNGSNLNLEIDALFNGEEFIDKDEIQSDKSI